VRQGRRRLLSQNGNDLTARFPAVAQALDQLPDGTVLDGELVVLDGDGYPDFA
jgi:ATP-dependent DNA ligase